MLNVIEPVFLALPERKAIQLSAVTDAHWEGPKLVLHFNGGAYMMLDGVDAKHCWLAITRSCVAADEYRHPNGPAPVVPPKRSGWVPRSGEVRS